MFSKLSSDFRTALGISQTKCWLVDMLMGSEIRQVAFAKIRCVALWHRETLCKRPSPASTVTGLCFATETVFPQKWLPHTGLAENRMPQNLMVDIRIPPIFRHTHPGFITVSSVTPTSLVPRCFLLPRCNCTSEFLTKHFGLLPHWQDMRSQLHLSENPKLRVLPIQPRWNT